MSSINLKIIVLLFAIVLSKEGYAQAITTLGLENKALDYFCAHIGNIKKDFTYTKVKFNGYTTGKASNIYEIANCVGDIKLIKDSIPNGKVLDSIKMNYAEKQYRKMKVNSDCLALHNNASTLLEKDIYRLYLFHAIEYKGYYWVQIFLANKKQQSSTIAIRFDKITGQIVDHCLSSLIY